MSKAITIIVIILIIAGAYYLYAPDSMRFWKGQTANVIDYSNNNSTNSEPTHETITAEHQFKDGNHVVAGEVNLPTACYTLSADAIVSESLPEQVTINFVAKTTGDPCIQVLTTERFKVQFKAAENATIKANWNGKPVELNLIPAGTNENLENFEIYNKG